MMPAVEAWRSRGRYQRLFGHEIFTVDQPQTGEETAPPLLLLHGFPTCSFDWRHTIDRFAQHRRVLALDFLGFGASEKPDQAYDLDEQASLAQAVVESAGPGTVDLVTHDMGDTIGGELLARALDGSLPFEVRRRVLVNGSIYIEMADLRAGQELLLDLPDEKLEERLPDELWFEGLGELFGPDTQPPREELEAQLELFQDREGDLLIPRTIRYIEQRRRHQDRWTGAIERHPSPLKVVWGEVDPVALLAMAHRLAEARPDVELVVLEGVGHFPMIEVPDQFAQEVLAFLDS